MRRLLRANFARLWKDRVLWITTAVVCLFGVIVCISQYNAMINYDVDMSGEFPRIFLNSYLMLRHSPTCSWEQSTATAP